MYHVSCIKSNNRGEKEEIRWIVDEKIEEENEEESMITKAEEEGEDCEG